MPLNDGSSVPMSDQTVTLQGQDRYVMVMGEYIIILLLQQLRHVIMLHLVIPYYEEVSSVGTKWMLVHGQTLLTGSLYEMQPLVPYVIGMEYLVVVDM